MLFAIKSTLLHWIFSPFSHFNTFTLSPRHILFNIAYYVIYLQFDVCSKKGMNQVAKAFPLTISNKSALIVFGLYRTRYLHHSNILVTLFRSRIFLTRCSLPSNKFFTQYRNEFLLNKNSKITNLVHQVGARTEVFLHIAKGKK